MLKGIVPFLLLVLIRNQEVDDNDEDQQFEQYATQMINFNPTQSFEFQLKATEQQTLILWPTEEINAIRGVFYLSGDQKGLFMGVEAYGSIKQSFYNKKLGVFNVPYSQAGDMKLIFKAQIQPVQIYVSYELMKKKEQQKENQQKKQQTQVKQKEEKIIEGQEAKEGQNDEKVNEESLSMNFDDKNELKDIVGQFQKVSKSLDFQQTILKKIVKHSVAESRRIESDINSKSLKVIIETLFVIGSGLISLYLLRKQFKKGYEILI